MSKMSERRRFECGVRERGHRRFSRFHALVVAAIALCIALYGAYGVDADSGADLRDEVERLRAEAADARREAQDVESRLKAAIREKKAALQDVAKLEELVAELRSAKRTDVMEMAKNAAVETAKRAKAFARDAEPFIKNGVKRINPALKTALSRVKPALKTAHTRVKPALKKAHARMKPALKKAHAKIKPALKTAHARIKPALKKAHARVKPALKTSRTLLQRALSAHNARTKEAKRYLAPLRRQIKTNLMKIDAFKPYATDKNINLFFDVVMNLALAYVIHKFIGAMYRGVFGTKIKEVPKHVRSKSVEFRPASPETRVFAPRE